MDLSVALILIQDGVANAAIYALLALALVLTFTVTRVIFVPVGEFVSFGALTLASLEAGQVPGTAWLGLGLGVLAGLANLWERRTGLTATSAARMIGPTIALPLGALLLATWAAPLPLPTVARVGLTLLLVAPMGVSLYDAVYRPIAGASVLVLLIVSVALHLVLVGFGLVFFGPEGSRTAPLSDATFAAGDLVVSGQSVVVLAVTAALIGALWAFFGQTLVGKALQATAVNRLGARLVGISPAFSGRVALGLATGIGTLGGVLIAPLTTIYYDTGFLIGLKGFVAAIVGGLVSFPVAAFAALGVGLLESFASFGASDLKEVIVFALILPVLILRSRLDRTSDEGE